MHFIVSVFSIPSEDSKNLVILSPNNWNDWFRYETVYYMTYIDKFGNRTDIGSVKIGQKKMVAGQRKPALQSKFNYLEDNFVSIGQDASYYKMLNTLGDDIRDEILVALRDFALNEDIFTMAETWDVTTTSLLRSVSVKSVRGQFRKLAQGDAELSTYQFSYVAPKIGKESQSTIELSVNVTPDSNPPTNVQVLIGRNGVGKTHLLNNMINSILSSGTKTTRYGLFNSEVDSRADIFANLVSISFSAFDRRDPFEETKDHTAPIKYSYIGLRQPKLDGKTRPPKSPIKLGFEFVKSVEACLAGSKNLRWKKALQELESDDIFKSADVSSIADYSSGDFEEKAKTLFKRMSSGHAIVLLTITRLVETLEEQSLVLIDEPEAHLHPPLLSAFVRALSDLLVSRNAVAIIATHSPVVLQEVPRSCVWKLKRSGIESSAEQLQSESFGENVGVLTQEVFGLEVSDSGFHKVISKAVDECDTYEEVIARFDGQLGLEAKAIIQTLLYVKNS